MKRIFGLTALMLALTGCNAGNAEMEQALAFRSALLGAEEVCFQTQICADYIDHVERFTLACETDSAGVVEFEVAPGSSLSSVSRKLEEAGLIHNHSVFKYMADLMGMGQKIQSGDYELKRSMSATEILDQLIAGDGKPLTTNITIRFNPKI